MAFPTVSMTAGAESLQTTYGPPLPQGDVPYPDREARSHG